MLTTGTRQSTTCRTGVRKVQTGGQCERAGRASRAPRTHCGEWVEWEHGGQVAKAVRRQWHHPGHPRMHGRAAEVTLRNNRCPIYLAKDNPRARAVRTWATWMSGPAACTGRAEQAPSTAQQPSTTGCHRTWGTWMSEQPWSSQRPTTSLSPSLHTCTGVYGAWARWISRESQ